MARIQIGQTELSVNPFQLLAPFTSTQRVARTVRGEVGVYKQGPNLRAVQFPVYIIRDDRTGAAVIDATTLIEALEDEVNRPYIITLQADELIRPRNPTGRYFASLDVVNPVVPGPGGKPDALLPGKTIYYQADVSGVVVPWSEYRRCRYHGPRNVTVNSFGLAGALEMPLPVLDGALDLNGSSQYAENTNVSSILNLTGSIKFKGTVKPVSVTGLRTYAAKRSAASNANFIVRQNGSRLEFSYHAATGGAEQTYQTPTGAVVVGVKQRVYVTFTFGTPGSIIITVGGVKITGGSWIAGDGTAAPATTSTTFSIGRDANAGNYYNGKIGDVSLESVLGSESDALLDSRLMASKLSTNTVGLWTLSEWIGNIAWDHTGNNDLTITGTPSFTGGYLDGSAPSETIDYFRRTSYGVIPIVDAQEQAVCLLDASDHWLSADKINVAWYGREVQVDNGMFGFRTRHEESNAKGRLDFLYWDKKQWNVSHTSAFHGQVKSVSGTWESFTDDSTPSIDLEVRPSMARVSLTYPSTLTNGYNVRLVHIIKRGCPIIKTEVWNAGVNLTAAKLVTLLTGASFTKRTQLGATVDAGSNNPTNPTSLTSGASATDAASYTTASITPSSRKLILLAFLNTKATTPDSIVSVEGCGLTWEQVATVTFNTIAAPTKRLTIFRAMSLSPPTSGTVVVSFGANTQTGGAWSIMESEGVDLSGVNGAGAIVQALTNAADSATSLTVTLAAFSNLANGTFGAHGVNVNNNINVGSGFTEIHDVGHAAPANHLQTEWRNDNDTTVDADNGAVAVAWGGIALELKAGETIGDSDSNNYNYVHTADPWSGNAVAAGFLRAKKTDSFYVASDAGAYWSNVGLGFTNLTIEENQAFPVFYWFFGRADCINRTVAQLAQLALREIVVEDDIERVVP